MLTGLARKSLTPRFIALVLVAISSLAVSRITGNDGRRRLSSRQTVQAVHFRHHHVEDDKIDGLIARAFQRIWPVECPPDVEAVV
jgi:hypothetical protein